MTGWLGQYCINVTDLDESVGFYTALGLENTSRTEIPQALEAIVEHPAGGSKLQLAQQKEPADPFDLGTGFWKLYVDTRDIGATYDAALAASSAPAAPRSPTPTRRSWRSPTKAASSSSHSRRTRTDPSAWAPCGS